MRNSWAWFAIFAILLSIGACAIGLTMIVWSNYQKPPEVQAGTYDYTINGERFQYATYCFTENGRLICDAEDGTRLYVDSYTPIYYER